MKRFWLFLFSLGLVVAFSASAFAVDVKVGAEYYAAGLYLNKTSLYDGPWEIPVYKYKAAKYDAKKGTWKEAEWKQEYLKGKKGDPKVPLTETVNESGSTAFFFQRLRVGTDFIVSPCLKLVTRFDAMERIWGGARSSAGTTADIDSAGTRAENQNIAFDYAYVDYVSPIGTFDIGYSSFGATGTVFANSTTAVGSIKYKYDFTKVPASLMLGISKIADNSASAVTSASYTDGDKDMYGIEGVYNFKNDKAAGKAGMKVSYFRYADTKPTSDYIKDYFQFTPYVIASIGPVNIQAELNWGTGNAKKFDTADTSGNKTLDQLNGWIDAIANFGKFYAGGTVAYISGDDPNTSDKDEGSANNGGVDWNPCLLMFNNDVTYWVGNVSGHNGSLLNGTMKNAWFFQGRVGAKPTPQWDIMMSVSHAIADKKPLGFANGTYGTEIDLTGTYKITNNLSYILGVGYLFAGDYFKGTGYEYALTDNSDPVPAGSFPPGIESNNSITNNFIVVNKLILSF